MSSAAARRVISLCLTLLAAATAPEAAGQTLGLRRDLPAGELTSTCPAISLPETPAQVNSAVTDSLLNEGSRAAILGDHPAARELLREAATSDPGNPVVAYRLARTLDEQGDSVAAVVEYCRYLAITPTAADTASVRARITDLAPPAAPDGSGSWRGEFTAGVEAFDRREYSRAVQAFSSVISSRPEFAAAYYNRAAALIAAGNAGAAASDLERYLEIHPSSGDAPLVSSVLAAISPAQVAPDDRVVQLRSPPGPGGVLLRGLVVPGLGQFATGRRLLGVGVLAGFGGALYFASTEEIVTRTITEQDPFGNPYEYQVRVRERPNQSIGFGIAAAVAVSAAVEGYFHARGQQRAFMSMEEEPVRPVISLHDTGRLQLGVSIRVAGR